MMNSPDVWISLRALPSPAPIDQQKQGALQAAYREFAQLGLNIRNGEMQSWASKLGQPGDWPLVQIEADAALHWEPISIVIAESAIRAAAANAVDGWEVRLINAVRGLLEAGLSVVVALPRVRRVIGEAEEIDELIRCVADPGRCSDVRCWSLQEAA